MSSLHYSLPELGWRPALMQQLTLEELEAGYAGRVSAVHRDRFTVLSETGEHSQPLTGRWLTAAPDERPTVGDWLWLDRNTGLPLRLLARQTLVQRTAAGANPKPQLIAANLDTLFIVSSCNDDLNPARLERYLALALDSGVEPVIVLTKADLCADATPYQEQAQAVRSNVPVLTLDAQTEAVHETLAPWLGPGQTVAFVGSSGVGKSTLTNTLMCVEHWHTQGIREDDAKGRHTTTARHMVALPDGTWVIDTPGMRELKLGRAAEGVHRVFDDLTELAAQCRFNDCQHQDDAGCALRAAVERGDLDPRRLESYLKLLRETARANTSEWRQRRHWKRFSKIGKRAQREKQAHRHSDG